MLEILSVTIVGIVLFIMSFPSYPKKLLHLSYFIIEIAIVIVLAFYLNGNTSSYYTMSFGIIFFILSFFMLKRLSVKTLEGLTIALILIPLSDYWILFFVLGIPFLVSFYLLRKTAGKDYVNMLTGETMSALGYAATVDKSFLGVGKPEKTRLPFPEDKDTETINEKNQTSNNDEELLKIRKASKIKINFLRYASMGTFIGLVILVTLQKIN